MKRLSCIIFDIDGTLTKTNELIFSSINYVSKKYLNKTFASSEITAMFGPPEEIVIEKLVGAELAPQALIDFLHYYETNHTNMVEAYAGIKEILEYLKANGILLAIFTGKGNRTASITLECLQIKNYFDLIVTGNDVDKHKPSSEGIRKVINTYHLHPQEVLMVGDSVADVKAANDAGIPIAAVLWDSYSKEQVMKMNVDYIFSSPTEFALWVTNIIQNNKKGSI